MTAEKCRKRLSVDSKTVTEEPLFRNFKGLDSFVSPSSFDEYIDDVVQHLERHLPCLVVPYVSTSDAYETFLRGIRDVPKEQMSLGIWLDVMANSVFTRMKFTVASNDDIVQNPVRNRTLDCLKEHPSHFIGVILGLATMRAALGISMQRCHISMSQLVELVERLSADADLWLFDQQDLLGSCGSFVRSKA